ncbi:MAG TPA: PEP-CTERM sorting domain-containing protein [archaeon]|nr:PEP-CTERM sorting domain-containing protein [archaeon]
MVSKSRWLLCLAVSLLVLSALSGTARADSQLITNGNFATGDLTGWTEADQAGGSGSWFVSSTTSSPLSGFQTPGPPGSDSFYALTDQTGPGSHVLIQSFTVPVGTTSLVLTFNMFSNDQDGGPFCPGALDYTIEPNQCARVDILTAGAGAFDTGAGVVGNLYETATQTVEEATNPWVSYTFDLTGLAPGTYQLRFGEVDNQDFFQQGVDDVSLVASTPEPGTLLLLGTGLLSALGLKRRKQLA